MLGTLGTVVASKNHEVSVVSDSKFENQIAVV